MKRISVYLWVSILAVVSYLDTISLWFVGSDSQLLVESTPDDITHSVVKAITTPYLSGTEFTEIGLFWRPVTTLTTDFTVLFAGTDPWIHHVVNVLLFSFATLLVTKLAMRIKDSMTGVLAGSYFALHPLAVEVIPVISRRGDILVTIFLLASVLCLYRSDRDLMWWFSAILFTLALLSKETAIFYAPIILTIAVIRSRGKVSERLYLSFKRCAPHLIFGVWYLGSRVAIVGLGSGYGKTPELKQRVASVARYVLSVTYPMDTFAVDAYALVFGILFTLISGVLFKFILIHDSNRLDNTLLTFAAIALGSTVVSSIWFLNSNTSRLQYFITGAIWSIFTFVAFSYALLVIWRTSNIPIIEYILVFGVWLGTPFITSIVFMHSQRSSLPVIAGFCVLLAVMTLTVMRSQVSRMEQIRLTQSSVAALLLIALMAPVAIAAPVAGHNYGWESVSYTMESTSNSLTDLNSNNDNIIVFGASKNVKIEHPIRAKSTSVIQPYLLRYWVKKGSTAGEIIISDRSIVTPPKTHANSTIKNENNTSYINVTYIQK